MSTPLASIVPKPRPYRRFLTSALHARFVQAALLTLVLAFSDGVLVGDKKDLFWAWFPFGPAGVRALLFFMTSLFLFILHIATLTVGRRTTKSPYATLWAGLIDVSTFQTWFWYTVSAFWFTEAYIWSCSRGAGLEWVTRGGMSSPDRLNERPIYVRAHFLVLAAVATGLHLNCDKSSMHIPIAKPASPRDSNQQTHHIQSLQAQFIQQYWWILIRSAVASGVAAILAPMIYFTFLRQTLWLLHLYFAKPWFNLSRADSRPSGFAFADAPTGLVYLFQSTLIGFLLMLTWELSSLLFMTCLKHEPIKSGLPFSAASKDPNGTLLNGIKAKRDIVKTYAFWELTMIAQKFPDRRKAIFADIDRATGPIWSQMLQEGLDVVGAMETRVRGPPSTVSAATATGQQPTITSLPKIVPEVGNQSIMVAKQPPRWSSQWAQKLAANELSQLGQSSDPWTPPVGEAKQAVQEYALGHGKAGKELVSRWYTAAQQYGWFRRCLKFFEASTSAKVEAVVLGYPYGNAALVVDACESLTKMLIASLAEDTYGKAMSGVPQTVKTLTSAIVTIEQYVEQNGIAGDSNIKEVHILLGRLKMNLNELLSAFQLFLSDRGLSISELNAAKKAAAEQNPIEEEKKGEESQRPAQTTIQDAQPRRKPQPEEARPRRIERQSLGDRQQTVPSDNRKVARDI